MTNIPIGNITNELATLADRLRQVTVKVRSGNLGIGAGTIWSSNGVIITNAHVAASNRAIVELADGREFPAWRTHFDPQQDLAALQIECADLVPAQIGTLDSHTQRLGQRLRSGELVLAVGNPLNDAGAATVGTLYSQQAGAIVADIRLYPGNSGGPLADCLGRVIGINTMIVDGLAVAIPISTVVDWWRRHGSHAPGAVR